MMRPRMIVPLRKDPAAVPACHESVDSHPMRMSLVNEMVEN